MPAGESYFRGEYFSKQSQRIMPWVRIIPSTTSSLRGVPGPAVGLNLCVFFLKLSLLFSLLVAFCSAGSTGFSRELDS